MWHYNTKVWTSRAEGAIWDKASIGDVQKRKVITVDVLLDIVSKHIQTHFSDLLKALYSLSQCYTGWYLSRNSGMVWIICIFTAWEHTGAGDLLVIIMLDQTQFSPLPVTLAFFFFLFLNCKLLNWAKRSIRIFRSSITSRLNRPVSALCCCHCTV